MKCPQRDSNPRYHLERVATWAASRWGRPSEDTRRRSYHPWPPGRLAQLVERLPYTQVAAGSSPAPPICRSGDMRNPHGGGGQLCAVTPPSRRRALVCLEASFGDRAMMCSFVRGHRMLGTRRSVCSPTRHLRHTCDSLASGRLRLAGNTRLAEPRPCVLGQRAEANRTRSACAPRLLRAAGSSDRPTQPNS